MPALWKGARQEAGN
uniref:Uncharacterized protein n=1 Tax=Arundo donax TaxID=35708 RepID=A0A0A9GE78_ARUDO